MHLYLCGNDKNTSGGQLPIAKYSQAQTINRCHRIVQSVGWVNIKKTGRRTHPKSLNKYSIPFSFNTIGRMTRFFTPLFSL